MLTAIGITLLVGVLLGVTVGIPLGRTWERMRPRRRLNEDKKER